MTLAVAVLLGILVGLLAFGALVCGWAAQFDVADDGGWTPIHPGWIS